MKCLYLLHDRRYTTTQNQIEEKGGSKEKEAYTIDSYIKGVGLKK